MASFSRTVQAETLSKSGTDTTQVNNLIRQSKELQWIDSYRSLNFADEALKLARILKYPKGIAISSNLKGFCFWSFGDNDLAIEAAMEALGIGEALNNPVIQAESYYILARGYMDIGESEKANESIVKAELFARQGTDWEQLVSIYNLKGVIRFIQNQRDSALYFYNKAYDTGKAHHVTPIHFPRIISNIGECYDDPVVAFSYFNKAFTLARETGNPIAEASITDIIGHAYLKRNDLKNAEIQLQSALQLARKLGLRRVVRHAYSGLVNIRLKQGRGDEAVVYLQRYYAVRDSLLNHSKIRQIVELEAKHDLQLKEQQVQILEKEKRIQTLWKNLLITLIIFLMMVSAGIYLMQRYRYRRNREMLNLEIDYLTRQHRETVDKYKASLASTPEEPLVSHDQKILKKAISIVENHISDPQFGVEKMAEEMNMSRTNLHRKIKSITGFPPSELIRSIRLRKAAKLILNKVDSVTQIAQSVGFDNYSHFSKVFKKHFGVSPTGYEEEHHLQHQINTELDASLKGE
jgi:AraC-like DNA-binding protein